MTLKLNQIIPIVRDFKGGTEKEATAALRAFGEPSLFEGHIHTYQPVDDENGEMLPQEKAIPQLDWRDVLESVFATIGKHGDNVMTMDVGNQLASADIIVDGQCLVESVPATHLIWLEKAMIDMRTLIKNIPILDPSVEWEFDSEQGYYKSEAVQTLRRVKVKRPIVLSEATDKHPAQVQLVDTDETVGYWNKVRQSKAIPHTLQDAMLKMIEKILVAIKVARAEANSQVIEKKRCLSSILEAISKVASMGH